MKKGEIANLGVLIGVFLAVILGTIIVPEVMTASKYQVGEYNEGSTYTFLYDSSSNFSAGHYGVTSSNITTNNMTYLSFDDSATRTGASCNTTNNGNIPFGLGVQNWSIVANINPLSTNTQDNFTILSKYGDTTNNGMIIGISRGEVFLLTEETKTECLFRAFYLNASADTDRWRQLVITFGVYQDTADNTSANATFYLDGVKMNNTLDVRLEADACPVNITDGVVVIGTSTDWGSWNGSIDYVRIYNETLGDSDVTAQFTAKQNRSLMHEWKFDENSGTVCYDAIGEVNGIRGTGAQYTTDGILNTLDSGLYTIDTTTATITGDAALNERVSGKLWEEMTWTYTYDNRESMGTGVETILTITAILFAIGVIIYGYYWIRKNLEGL